MTMLLRRGRLVCYTLLIAGFALVVMFRPTNRGSTVAHDLSKAQLPEAGESVGPDDDAVDASNYEGEEEAGGSGLRGARRGKADSIRRGEKTDLTRGDAGVTSRNVKGDGPVQKSINTSAADWIARVDNCYKYGEKKTAVSEALQAARNCKRRLPLAMIVGVKKCGTGTLGRYLDLHPAVSVSRELSVPGGVVNENSVSEWVRMMPLSSEYQLPMTGNPVFMFGYKKEFVDLKPFLSPKTKFIVILRDPVQRAMSDYLHRVYMSGAPSANHQPFTAIFKGDTLHETFEKTVVNDKGNLVLSTNIIDIGHYFNAIRSVLQVYKKEQFIFVDGDKFARDPFPTMLQMEEFLELPKFYKRAHFELNEEKGFYCANVPERPDFKCMIPTKGRHHPEIAEDVLRKVRDHYRPHNQDLADLLGQNFTWMNT